MLSMEMVLTPVNLLCSRLRKKGEKLLGKKACFSLGKGNFYGVSARCIVLPVERYTSFK